MTRYSYDPVSRLSELSHDFAGTDNDLTLGFSYNPAGQIVSTTRSNDAYAFTAHESGTVTEVTNGLNQLVNRGGAAIGYDARGNVTNDPATGYTFSYSPENLLTTVYGPFWAGSISYDPLMRLYEAGANGTTRALYDGEERIGEMNSDRLVTLRIVHGPGANEPLVTYDDTNGRRFLYADERGSIIAGANSSGAVDKIYAYDEFGIISAPRHTRFEFTGHVYESVSGLLYARARMYNPKLGRFMQPDPIGYDDGMNMYARTKGDPVNRIDPSGLSGISYFCQMQGYSGADRTGVFVGQRQICTHLPTGDGGSRTGAPVPTGPEKVESAERWEVRDPLRHGPLYHAPPKVPGRRANKQDFCGGSGLSKALPEGGGTNPVGNTTSAMICQAGLEGSATSSFLRTCSWNVQGEPTFQAPVLLSQQQQHI